MQRQFGRVGTGDGLLRGDANDDGAVSGADLLEVQRFFGSVFAHGPVGAPVPEPTSLVLALLAFSCLRRVVP